jgi:hypothetical protein
MVLTDGGDGISAGVDNLAFTVKVSFAIKTCKLDAMGNTNSNGKSIMYKC